MGDLRLDHRYLRFGLLLFVALALVAGLVQAAAAAPAGATAPRTAVAADPAARPASKDYPRLPKRCVSRDQTIPVQAGVCRLTKVSKNRPTVVIWGDSHAWQQIPAIRLAARGKPVNVVAFVMGSCPPAQLRARPDGPCTQNAQKALAYIKSQKAKGHPTRVVLGGYWRFYRKTLSEHRRQPQNSNAFYVKQSRMFSKGFPPLLKTLGKLGVPTDIVAQTVTVSDKAPRCSIGQDPYVCDQRRRLALDKEADTRKYLVRQMRKLRGDKRYVDVNSSVCSRTICRGRADGIATFYDNAHITATRGKTLAPFWIETISRAARMR